MSGFKEAAYPGEADAMQQDVQRHVRGLAQSRNPGKHRVSQQAALTRLLQGRSPYLQGAGPTKVTSFKFDLVSLPETLEGCPLVDDLAPPRGRRFLGGVS